MKIDGEFETDYWGEVILEWENSTGNINRREVHSHRGELEELCDQILDRLQEYEDNPSGFHADPTFTEDDLEGFPEETMLPRDYTHDLVALFALSCGIMEKQLGILLTFDLIPESRRDGYPNNQLDSMSLRRKLEFAKAADVIGNGIYSEAWDVRKTRNKLVHNPVHRFSLVDYNTHRNRVNKTVRAPNNLDDLIRAAL